LAEARAVVHGNVRRYPVASKLPFFISLGMGSPPVAVGYQHEVDFEVIEVYLAKMLPQREVWTASDFADRLAKRLGLVVAVETLVPLHEFLVEDYYWAKLARGNLFQREANVHWMALTIVKLFRMLGK
jgi:hypothetical protein